MQRKKLNEGFQLQNIKHIFHVFTEGFFFTGRSRFLGEGEIVFVERRVLGECLLCYF